jgi:Spy/CpxP family protein refolding chaperone
MNKHMFAFLAAGTLAASLASAQQPGSPPSRDQASPQGGRQYGPGMMGGPYGMMGGGYGMMGFGALGRLPDLTADQRGKINAIQRELRDKQFALMDQMHDQMLAGRYYRNGQFDEQAVRRNYDVAEKLHRQMFENALDAQKRVDALLTPQQRQQLARQWGGQ